MQKVLAVPLDEKWSFNFKKLELHSSNIEKRNDQLTFPYTCSDNNLSLVHVKCEE